MAEHGWIGSAALAASLRRGETTAVAVVQRAATLAGSADHGPIWISLQDSRVLHKRRCARCTDTSDRAALPVRLAVRQQGHRRRGIADHCGLSRLRVSTTLFRRRLNCSSVRAPFASARRISIRSRQVLSARVRRMAPCPIPSTPAAFRGARAVVLPPPSRWARLPSRSAPTRRDRVAYPPASPTRLASSRHLAL